MPDSDADVDGNRADDERPEPDVADGVASTEAYEAEEGVVFYDADNPLAWIQAEEAVDLDGMA